MKFTNESGIDRAIRVALGIVMLSLGWAGVVTGGWGVVFRIGGFLPLLAGLIGFCPLYAILKFRTNRA
jgi:hypothetical protein